MADTFDFIRCEDEPIHIPSKIQPLGQFLALDANKTIRYVSQNFQELGIDANHLLGLALDEVFPNVDKVVTKFLASKQRDKRKTYFDITLEHFNRTVHLYVSHKEDFTIIEMIDAASLKAQNDVMECIDVVQRFTGVMEVEPLYEEVVCAIKELTDYDRVMLYKFDDAYNGQVIAEAKQSSLESYKDLHYPASDIPAQARQLYLQNPIRIIKDVDYTPISIVTKNDATIDMSLSFLRSVSPIHLQYMKNMGVYASMTISIIIDGKLWGLVACHNQTPYLPSIKTIYTCEKISSVIASLIQMFQTKGRQEKQTKFLASIDTLTSVLRTQADFSDIHTLIAKNLKLLFPLFHSDGVIVKHKRNVAYEGLMLSNEQIAKLTAKIATFVKANDYITTALAEDFKDDDTLLRQCAGVVAFKMSAFDTLVIFTKVEQIQTIHWGGDPTKPVQELSPRTSFEKFSQTVTKKSLPWDENTAQNVQILKQKLHELFEMQSSKKQIQVQQSVINILEEEKTKNQAQLIEMLISMIEQRDAYTAGHTQRVADYCSLIATQMGLDDEQIERLNQAAKLHDIGKISIPDSILLKPGKLSHNEYSLIKMHLDVGYDILSKIDYYKEVAEIMCNHHEKYDGSGYPNGKKGDEIPVLGHIMIVADALDAMTTNRIYQSRKSVDEAVEEIKVLSGVWYHPEVVDAVLALHEKNAIVAAYASQLPLTQIEHERFSYFFKDRLTAFFNESYLWMILNKNIPDKELNHFVLIEMRGMTKYNKIHGWTMGSQLIDNIAKYIKKSVVSHTTFRVFGDDFVLGFVDANEKDEFLQTWQEIKIGNVHTSIKEVQKSELIAKMQTMW